MVAIGKEAFFKACTKITERLGKPFEQRQRVVEREAGIGDALAVAQRVARAEFLRAALQVALDHHAANAALPRADL